MPKRLIASALLALPLVFTACDMLGTRSDPDTSVEQARWSADTVRQLRGAIDRRAGHGLDRMTFALDGRPGTAEGEAALTRSALHYAAALARGASDPVKLYKDYTLERAQVDLEGGLARALAAGTVDEWLESLAPQHASYRQLSKAYLALRGAGAAAPEPAIPDVAAPLKPGQTDARVPAIARQLVASDYLDRAQAQGNRYNEAMVQAVRRMQADYGIAPDGIVGGGVIEILNLSDADRARAIAVALERLRWLEREPPATRIDVNIAAAQLSYWREGKIVDRRKVVVGKPGNETPQLDSPIYRLVANPTWTVPRSIERKEIADKGEAYLRRNNMAWQDGWIVQQPGPQNSLGLVKFDMKNDHQIYLHDTPAKALFDEVQRQRSHGCVRVDDALGFAELLARDEGVLDAWNRARASGQESFVPLPREIPVRLFYQTVLLDEAGEPVIRADPYGWNERVAVALGFPAREDMRFHPSTSDVGP